MGANEMWAADGPAVERRWMPDVEEPRIAGVVTDRERWQRLQDVFHAAVGLDTAERAGYLDRSCRDDARLRQEAEVVIAASRDAAELADEVHRAASAALATASPVGARLGPYRIVKELGHGGMGRVFLGQRDDDQFQRRVAVKVAHAAQAPEMLARFRSERQILAGLDHPNIARLLDGGTTEEGVPYLVLEYVEGEPIDRYCDSRQLPVTERLRLFRAVCGAVHYAHQNHVVHRDLKPGNVLVTADGTPKLLDFGIAKLLKPDMWAQAPVLTSGLYQPMTPEYASPEQVRGEVVTTASDVYSLGVVLYELLTGSRPLRLEGESPTGIRRIVGEVEPAPPSEVMRRGAADDDGRTAGERSRRRGTSPEKLRRALEGDLDNIVLMALRKAPTRRYASVEQLSEDVQRHVEGLPVRARKDTIRYRTGKFVRRQRYALGTAAAFFALATGFGVNRAHLERELEQQLADGPEVADSFHRLAQVLEDKGELPQAESLARRALDIARRGPAENMDTARYLAQLGDILRQEGELDAAEAPLRQSLAIQRRIIGDRNPEVALGLNHLANLARDRGQFAAAERLYLESIELYEQVSEADLPLAAVRADHGELLAEAGRLDDAEEAYRQSLEVAQRFGRDTLLSLASRDGLARVAAARGTLAKAAALYRDVLEARRRTGQDGNLRAAATRLGLGRVLAAQGEAAAAEPLLRQALQIRLRCLPARHPLVAEARSALESDLVTLRRFAETERLRRDALIVHRGTQARQATFDPL